MTPRYDPTGETDRLRADMEHAQTKAAVARADADALVAKLTPLRAVAFAAANLAEQVECSRVGIPGVCTSEQDTCRETMPGDEGEWCAVCWLEVALDAWTGVDR